MNKTRLKIKEIDQKLEGKISALSAKKRALFLSYRKKLEEEKIKDLRRQINNSK